LDFVNDANEYLLVICINASQEKICPELLLQGHKFHLKIGEILFHLLNPIDSVSITLRS